MGRIILVVSVVVISLFQEMVLFTPTVSHAADRICTNEDFVVGLNRARTQILINERAEFQINAVTNPDANNNVRECVKTYRQHRTGISINEFDDQQQLFSGARGENNTFSSYTVMHGTFGGNNLRIRIVAIVSEQAIEGTHGNMRAQYQGLFFQFLDPQGRYTNKFYKTRDANRRFLEGELFVGAEGGGGEVVYRELFNLQGKTLTEGGVVQTERVSLEIDFSIDYAGSKIGSRNPPYVHTDGAVWGGNQDNLPKFETVIYRDALLHIQLWRKTGEAFIFHKSYTKTLQDNPTDGKFTINDELGVGEYALTSFLQIAISSGRFVGLRYAARMLGDPEEITGDVTNLDAYTNQLKQTIYDATYEGVGGVGLTDLFMAQSNFSVAAGATNNHDLSPIYKHIQATRDIYQEWLTGPECSLRNIMGQDTFGKIVNEAVRCFIMAIIVPVIEWTVNTLLVDAIGVAYGNFMYQPRQFLI